MQTLTEVFIVFSKVNWIHFFSADSVFSNSCVGPLPRIKISCYQSL